ncbi:calcium-binding protein [Mesorhizobium sp. NBSH29]|uniref:calcium-binding protein n=1 Tax=Mesorhizobium sp. NBSH29 TaxID=2654249 RepID=UPI0018966639|nr:calcium-binding protein [Mesorhizobium sp. NBSH29]
MSINNLSVGMHAINNSWSSGSPAHEGITNQALFQLAAEGGSTIIRVPFDLSVVGPSGPPQWSVDSIGAVLQQAAALGLKVILEPGQTPPDLLPASAPLSQAPETTADLEEMSRRFGALVEAVHTQYGQYASTIAAWEVGNEPNLSFQNDGVYHGGEGDPSSSRFYVVGLDNAEAYARMLSSASNAVSQVEASLGQSITLIAAGVAHNDYAYMDRMLSTLSSLGGSVDGFSIHPYTTYDYHYRDPSSSRPTEWIGAEGAGAEQWDHYHSFQGALYQGQALLNKHGFSEADLWLTEFGVPSYLGYRNAGEAGRIDQANWYAEAFGVLDSWGNDNLKGIIAHSVLDIRYKEENDSYNGFDQTSGNDGSSSIAEGSFGLYERSSASGVISEKPVVALFEAIAGGVDFASSQYRVISRVSTDGIDVSGWGTNGVGLANGYIILTHDGDDKVIGSAYDDSLFAGDGDDTVDGGTGDDRIYGGRGDDELNGGDGDDDIYGNHGADRINAGANINRVDGGTGLDTLVLSGSASDFIITGDGRFLTASAVTGWQTTTAINVEQVYFTVEGTTVLLANGDTNAGNGGLPGSGSTPIYNPVHGTVGDDTLNGTNGKDVIFGYEGVDRIFGFDEDDRIFGGEGDDVISPGWGANEINAGAGVDTVIIDGRESDYSVSVNGLTVQVGGPGIWNLITHAEWIVFDSPEGEAKTSINVEALLASTYNQITGTAGDDYIEGTSVDDRILGSAGNDTLYGGAGDDVMQGQGGAYNQVDYDGGPTDYTFVRNDNDTVTVTSAAWGTDTLTEIDAVWFRGAGQWYAIEDLFGSSGPGDTVTGSAGDDFLSGTSGGDTILGGDGNDTLYGYLGDDLLDGQGGSYNQVDYDGAAADYLFSREPDGSVTVSHDVYGTDTLRNIDGVWFYDEERWYALDALAPENMQQASGFNTSPAQGSRFSDNMSGGSAAQTSDGSRSEPAADPEGDMLAILLDLSGIYGSVPSGGISNGVLSADDQYIRSEPIAGIMPGNILENLSFALSDTWFEPEPIGGLL